MIKFRRDGATTSPRSARVERILPAAIVEQFVARADGELEPLVEGSTKSAGLTVTHAGICKVKRYAFDMP